LVAKERGKFINYQETLFKIVFMKDRKFDFLIITPNVRSVKM